MAAIERSPARPAALRPTAAAATGAAERSPTHHAAPRPTATAATAATEPSPARRTAERSPTRRAAERSPTRRPTATAATAATEPSPALRAAERSPTRRAAGRLAVAVATVAAVIGLAGAPAAADWVRNDQWQMRELDARAAWRLANGDGIVVAVVDSGVDATHPDLTGQVLPGADFVDGSTDGRRDPVGHGTTVAGLIAGRGDDSNGVVGLAPKAKVLPVRVLDKDNKYDDPAVVANGIRWAVDHGASIVNLSLGGLVRTDVLADALRYAASRDVVVVACTGNITSGSTSRDVWYPAREPGVVAVAGLVDSTASSTSASTSGAGGTGGSGGTAGSEALWSGSLTGPQTVLTAPAVNLLGAKPGGYWRVQGTSFAAPLVSAAAALIRSRFPGMSAANVINRLIHTARDLGAPGRDDRYGFGEVNPVAAVRTELPAVTVNPLGGAPGRPDGPDGGSATRPDHPPDGADAPGGRGSVVPDRSSPAAPAAGGPGGTTDGPDASLATRRAAEQRRLSESVVLGGAVTALLFLLGLTITWRRRSG